MKEGAMIIKGMDKLTANLMTLDQGYLRIFDGTMLKINPTSYLEFETAQISCSIDKRPSYCDRGRYRWLAKSKDNRILTIDAADMFPRYFFNIGALVMEIESWLKARKQNEIIKIVIKDNDKEIL
jgi:hypothetical protein